MKSFLPLFLLIFLISCNSRQLITSSVITITHSSSNDVFSHGQIISSDTIISRSDTITALAPTNQAGLRHNVATKERSDSRAEF